MLILSIDTSTKHFSLAVSENGTVLGSKSLKSKKVLSSTIIPAIEKVLKKAGVTLDKIDGFAVGLGPGSFTSLRVGVATVKGLAYAMNKPIVGVPSLDVLALNVKRKNAQVCTVCDARRDMVFGCVYDKEGMNIRKKTDHMLTGIKDVLQQVSGDVVFIGDGLNVYKDHIVREEKLRMSSTGRQPLFVYEEKKEAWYPKAKNLAVIAYKAMVEKKFDKIENILPVYLYPEDCQVKGKK